MQDFSVTLYGYFGVRLFEPRLYRENERSDNNAEQRLTSLDPLFKE